MTTENFKVELRKVITRKMYLNPWRGFRDGREIKDFIKEQGNYNFDVEATVKLGVLKHYTNTL